MATKKVIARDTLVLGEPTKQRTVQRDEEVELDAEEADRLVAIGAAALPSPKGKAEKAEKA